jgi:hypothetical protein
MADVKEDIGYLKGKVESNSASIDRLVEVFTQHIEKQDENTKAVNEALQAIRDELSVYKAVVRVIKFIGAVALAVVTFQFGDIDELWEKYKK